MLVLAYWSMSGLASKSTNSAGVANICGMIGSVLSTSKISLLSNLHSITFVIRP